jgi:hypothetical protein
VLDIGRVKSYGPEKEVPKLLRLSLGAVNIDAMKQVKKFLDALRTDDAHVVVALFSKNAVLLPTLTPKTCYGRKEIFEYFDDLFLPQQPKGLMETAHIKRLGIGSKSVCGDWVFKVLPPGRTIIKARYSIVFQRKYIFFGKWEILQMFSCTRP